MPVDATRAIDGAPRTTQRLLCGAVVGCLLLGLAGSALAVRNTGTTRHRSKSQSRATVSARTYAPLPPAVESLELPRAGLPADTGGMPRLGVNAASAILVDAKSGVVLYERYPDAPLPPASVTKILTALIILERGRLSDTVVVSQAAAQTGGQRLGLRAGQRITLGGSLGRAADPIGERRGRGGGGTRGG